MYKGFRFSLPSPALVLSVLALILALGGTALAAGSVSTAKRHADVKQDKKLIRKMAKHLSVKHAKTAGHANTAANATHATTADSATNADNATHATSSDTATHATSADTATNATTATTALNATGLAGPLAAGQTLTGTWDTAGHKATAGDFVDESSLSFAIQLSAAPTANFITVGGAPTTNCPGSATAPAAAAGQLCLYATLQTGATGLSIATTKYGAFYFPTGVAAPSNYEVRGVWAVKSALTSAPTHTGNRSARQSR